MNFAAKSGRLYCLLALFFGFSIPALCENTPLCQLGEAVVEEMSFQLSANGKIDPTTLSNSAVYLEKCPGAVIPSFDQFAIDKEALHRAWIAALKSNSSPERRSDLGYLLAAAHRSVIKENSQVLNQFLDGIFDHSLLSPGKHSSTQDHLFEQQSSSTLIQFSHCDAAECYDISDILLFLLGTHPVAFWSAMHSNSDEATKWLSQLQYVSFAGEPSQAQSREQIRKFLLTQISIPVTSDFQNEKSKCISKLSRISYRSWQ